MKPIQFKKHKNVIFHKANFKNAQRFCKFISSKEIVSFKDQNLTDQLNKRENSLKSLGSASIFKKIENKFLFSKNQSLFKNIKRIPTSNNLNIIKDKDFSLRQKNINKQKVEIGKKGTKQTTQKITKIINNKDLKRHYSCNKINKLKLCKTFFNNNDKDINTRENEQETIFNNIKKDNKRLIKTNDKEEIKNKKSKEVEKTRNFVKTIKHKLLCCIYL